MGPSRNRLFTKRRIIVGAVAMVVIAGGTGTWFATRSSATTTPTITTTNQVTTVSTGTIVQTVSSTGTIEPSSQANLSFAVTGRVTAAMSPPARQWLSANPWPPSIRQY